MFALRGGGRSPNFSPLPFLNTFLLLSWYSGGETNLISPEQLQSVPSISYKKKQQKRKRGKNQNRAAGKGEEGLCPIFRAEKPPFPLQTCMKRKEKRKIWACLFLRVGRKGLLYGRTGWVPLSRILDFNWGRSCLLPSMGVSHLFLLPLCRFGIREGFTQNSQIQNAL